MHNGEVDVDQPPIPNQKVYLMFIATLIFEGPYDPYGIQNLDGFDIIPPNPVQHKGLVNAPSILSNKFRDEECAECPPFAMPMETLQEVGPSTRHIT